MYLQNKYTKWYNSVITNAKSRVLTGYQERHHIIPKSLGGPNDNSNLVYLTAREHFICHWLLTKMTLGTEKSKMWYALAALTRLNKEKRKLRINSRLFNQIRQEHAEAVRSKRKGRSFNELSLKEQQNLQNMWNKRRGTKLSSEAIQKREQTKLERGTRRSPPSALGLKRSESTKEKQRALRWYNNGEKNIKTSNEPPKDFVPGRLKYLRSN